MAHRSLPRSLATVLMLSSVLTACSADSIVPPASIDGARVGAIGPSVRAVPRQHLAQPYPVNDGVISRAGQEASGQWMREPQTMETAARPQVRRLPMIDSDEAMGQQSQQQLMPDASGGVNMDEGLGVAPMTGMETRMVTGLAQEQDQMIAEGNASQPVVAGIGTESPTQVGQPIDIPMSEADGEIAPVSPPVWRDNSPVVAPRRPAPRSMAQPQEVAMLPRAQNPMNDSGPMVRSIMPASEVSCRAELRRLNVAFADMAPISQGPSCGVPYPMKISGLAGGIDIRPAPVVNCQIALAFAKWVKFELAPSSRFRYLSGVQRITPMGGYSCRKMNSRSSNPWSEHARGNAIDIGTITLNSGKEIDVRRKGFFAFREKGLLKAVRSDSCRYFSTVLGPGSDPSHWNHFHFDLRTRKSGYRHCD